MKDRCRSARFSRTCPGSLVPSTTTTRHSECRREAPRATTRGSSAAGMARRAAAPRRAASRRDGRSRRAAAAVFLRLHEDVEGLCVRALVRSHHRRDRAAHGRVAKQTGGAAPRGPPRPGLRLRARKRRAASRSEPFRLRASRRSDGSDVQPLPRLRDAGAPLFRASRTASPRPTPGRARRAFFCSRAVVYVWQKALYWLVARAGPTDRAKAAAKRLIGLVMPLSARHCSPRAIAARLPASFCSTAPVLACPLRQQPPSPRDARLFDAPEDRRLFEELLGVPRVTEPTCADCMSGLRAAARGTMEQWTRLSPPAAPRSLSPPIKERPTLRSPFAPLARRAVAFPIHRPLEKVWQFVAGSSLEIVHPADLLSPLTACEPSARAAARRFDAEPRVA